MGSIGPRWNRELISDLDVGLFERGTVLILCSVPDADETTIQRTRV
jgi:hypothetical protein